MEAQLKKNYMAILAPAVAGFIVMALIRSFAAMDPGAFKPWQPIAGPLLFIMSIVFAVALPLLMRTLFVHKHHQEKGIPEIVLLKFERNTMFLALMAPYFALAAFVLEIPRFHLAGAILASFYAVYYFYPSRKHIQYERRIFRAK